MNTVSAAISGFILSLDERQAKRFFKTPNVVSINLRVLLWIILNCCSDSFSGIKIGVISHSSNGNPESPSNTASGNGLQLIPKQYIFEFFNIL